MPSYATVLEAIQKALIDEPLLVDMVVFSLSVDLLTLQRAAQDLEDQ